MFLILQFHPFPSISSPFDAKPAMPWLVLALQNLTWALFSLLPTQTQEQDFHFLFFSVLAFIVTC
jgi:hypothetical protein